MHFKSEHRIYHQYVDEQIKIEYNRELEKEILEYLPQARIWSEKEN